MGEAAPVPPEPGSSSNERARTRLKTTTTGWLFVAGGAAGALTTADRWGALGAATTALLVLTAVAVAVGVLLMVRGDRTPAPGFHVVVAAGSVLVGAAVVLSAGDTAAMGVAAVFGLCGIGLLHFFEGRPAVLHGAFQVLALAVSLSWRGVHPGVVAAQVLVQVCLVVVVGRLVLRAADSVRDSLTGLPNRRGFDELLDEVTALARREQVTASLALLDVDHFKAVNDSGGHAAGDALLSRLAGAWAAALPPGHHLSRQGGDEFALLAPGSTAAELEALCARLRELTAPVGVSAGVAELGEGEGGASLVRRADTALYAAKAAGRGCTRTADPGGEALSAELAAAIADGAVAVVLQPVVRPATGELVAVEALARWRHPERGAVPPSVFVPLAEQTGQVHALGQLVLTHACQDAATLSAELGREVLLTVNTSGHQLTEPGFVDSLAGVLLRTGWRADQLVLEVTESTVEIASTTALEALAQVRELGVAVAIDDFGTGYSAFSHLDTLPADYLKLDAAFTAGVTTSTRRAAMLVALLDLCDQLGITVIAEGVEAQEHAHLLTLLGCPLAQGYHYARPAPVHELVRLVREGGLGPAPARESGAQGNLGAPSGV
ncbi:putative bifunctional diguanylate cyclase/phosphodiesterase [Quadrisphaera sp. KR29]|uniref:putative bifunctional diguanylate cyclase/phosphodiesterase n=1 Tax=Quadrisphaera sp. KR29 TaxID=3461391 RepID=UPI004043FDDE